MKLFLIFLLAIFVYSCSSNSNSRTEDLKNAIDQFNEAFERGDTAKLSEMITDNYVHTNGSWKSFGKDQWMIYMNARSEKIQSGALIINQYLMEELSISDYEQSAIVTAKIATAGIEDGIPFNKEFRVSNFWVYRGSRWLRAGFHDTTLD